ncbi:MAG: hypothetical protein KJ579_00415 [Verrucomicrobia bacterium]|nr:hypothetical protein [Verrucomicrobiota bacterium]
MALPVLAGAGELRLAVFDADVTPPVGSMMAYDPVLRVEEMSLRGRGIVLLGSGKPIVLCALDWIGLYNESHERFRQELARAAGTDPDRVAVHCVHQHDAPRMDTGAEAILRESGWPAGAWDSTYSRPALNRVAEALRASLTNASPVTHAGWGSATVERVASNRRLPGPDGRLLVRFTTEKNAEKRAAPEGTVDPAVDVVSFWNGDVPLAVLSYYACHPQSYYRTGVPSPDFPGIARFIRGQDLPGALHVHFTGAAGNIGAGKYNDGSKTNRMALALRLADGMRRAFEATEKIPLGADDLGWSVEKVRVPVAAHVKEDELVARLKGPPPASGPAAQPDSSAAVRLAFLRRMQAGRDTLIPCLRLGTIRILHMPGELFVEYQLAAKAMRPDLHVALAAYGDVGLGYIGTEKAYAEIGGYETEPRSSPLAPAVEGVLTAAMRRLLQPAPAP